MNRFMKFLGTAALCAVLGTTVIPALPAAAESGGAADSSDPAVCYLSDMELGGYVGDAIHGNIANWQMEALEENPNIVEEIANASRRNVNFSSLTSDPYGVREYFRIEQDTEGKGLAGKGIKYTYRKEVTAFADIDFAFSKDVTVNTDSRGAEELWLYVNASEFGTENIPIRLSFEEGDPGTAVRESWKPRANVTVYTIEDGAASRTEHTTDAEGFVSIEPGFKGWVCYPLNDAVYEKYWSSVPTSNGVIDKSDIHQIQYCMKGNATALNKSFYLDALSLVGTSLTEREGVTGVPTDVPEFADKEFRQLWTMDYPETRNTYSGSIMVWYGEFAGKLLTGMVFSYKLTADPDLREKIEELVDALIAAQGEDGYIGTYTDGRFSVGADNWDLWNHYHIIYGMYQWWRVSGDTRALRVCTRALDYIISFMNDNNGGSFVPSGGLEMNAAIGHAFALIYKATGEQRYLDACLQMVNTDWDRIGNWYKEALEGKDFYQAPLHRWEALHPISMLATLYEVTGEQDYYDALEHIWYSIAKTDRHNAGSYSSGEGSQGTPYLSGAGAEIETCCTVAWMALGVEYYSVSKNPYVIDELELSFFNGMLGSLLENRREVTYNTPMVGQPTGGSYDGRKIDSATDIGFQWNSGSPDFTCCQANAARGLAQLSEWGVATDLQNLYVNYYGPSTAHTLTPGGNSITLKQTTEYPKNGEIVITLGDMKQAEYFTMNFRIPSWSKQTVVQINDEPAVSVQSGSYYDVSRNWKNGDTIRISLEMSVHFWAGEELFEGYTSAYYGPILMTLDERAEPERMVSNTKFNATDFLNVKVSSAAEDGGWLYFDVADRNGQTVRLVDYASAGWFVDGEPGNYTTWLDIESDELSPMRAGREYPPVYNNMLSYSVSGGEGVTLAQTSAKGGSTASFSVSVPEGKVLESISVSTARGEVAVTEDDGGYSFEMPNADVTVTANFADEAGGCAGSAGGVALPVLGGTVLAGGTALLVRKKKRRKNG